MEQAQAISATDGVVGKLEQKAEEETKTGQPVADTTTSSGRGTPAQGSSGDGEGQGEGEGGEEELPGRGAGSRRTLTMAPFSSTATISERASSTDDPASGMRGP